MSLQWPILAKKTTEIRNYGETKIHKKSSEQFQIQIKRKYAIFNKQGERQNHWKLINNENYSLFIEGIFLHDLRSYTRYDFQEIFLRELLLDNARQFNGLVFINLKRNRLFFMKYRIRSMSWNATLLSSTVLAVIIFFLFFPNLKK